MDKAVSIDIETLGLNGESIIQFGAHVFDVNTREPGASYEVLIEHETYTCDPVAAVMNVDLLRALGDRDPDYTIVGVNEFARDFSYWLGSVYHDETIVWAGKNVATFDLPRLSALPDWDTLFKKRTHRRVLDPSVLYWQKEDGSKLPNMQTCMERARMSGLVAHTALEDAIVVAQLIQWRP